MSVKDDNYYARLLRRKDVDDFVKLQEGLTRVIEPKTQKTLWLTPKQEMWCRKLAELKIQGEGHGILRKAALAAGYGADCATEENRNISADRASTRNQHSNACYLRVIEIIRELHAENLNG